ncbi:MAG: RHS repeat-associated core domain-containing protein [Caldilineaceae bacterium]
MHFRATAVAPQGTVAYTYDAAGQRSTMTLPNNRTVSYTYHPTGNVATVTDWLGGVQTFSYNADGNLLQVGRPNSINSTYGYDAAGQLTSIAHDGTGGTIQSYSYTLDPNGNRIAVAMPGGTESYTLDSLNRLTGVSYPNGDSASYTYDANGNRLSETFNSVTTNYTYDDAGQLLTDGNINFTYDANGNLTVAGSDTYTWDWSDRLVAATVAGNNVSYSYDAFDVRVGATVNGAASNYLWDRQAAYPLLVDDGSTAYLHNNGPLAQIDGSGNRHYLLTDALHSVRGLVDGAGALVGSTEYAAFGALRNQTGMTSSMGFTGELFSVATGLLHLRARDLLPNLGRFLSVDTVQPNAPGTMGYNLYAYAANNPTTWVDPSGHFTGPGFDPSPVKDVVPLLPSLIPAVCSSGIGSIICLIALIVIVFLVLLWLMDLFRHRVPTSGDGPLTRPDGEPGQEPPKPTPTPDDSSQYDIFISGNDTPETSAHIASALQANPGWTFLHAQDGRHDSNWLNNRKLAPQCANKQKGEFCDEYPFATTVEGGMSNWPSLKLVPDWEQYSFQGPQLRWFYAKCQLARTPKSQTTPVDGSKFMVKVDFSRHTGYECKNGIKK